MLRSLMAMVMMGLVAGCAGASNENGSTESDLAGAGEYRLPGVSETLLISDSAGHASILHLGDPTSVTPLESGKAIVAGRSFEGRFWALDEEGSLLVIDPAGGAPARTALGIGAPSDLEIESASSAWISAGTKLVRIDPQSGATLATIDFSSHALDGGTIEARGIKRVGTQLFVQLGRKKGAVQRGAVAIIDLANASLESVIELEVGAQVGYDPGGAMVVDAVHHKLLLTARGFRPSNTGMVLRIDLATKALDPWFFRSGAGFQGGLALGADPSSLYIGYHTSTPVASTHLFQYVIGDDAELVPAQAGTLLDAFEVVDDYPSSANGALFALPVTCPVGFCIGGKGVSFIDTKTGTAHPRVPEAALGMSPGFVLFL